MEDIFEKLAALRATAGTRMKKMAEERERAYDAPKEVELPDAYEHRGDCRCIKCGREVMWRYYQAHG